MSRRKTTAGLASVEAIAATAFSDQPSAIGGEQRLFETSSFNWPGGESGPALRLNRAGGR
jgi:hypothetical protein